MHFKDKCSNFREESEIYFIVLISLRFFTAFVISREILTLSAYIVINFVCQTVLWENTVCCRGLLPLGKKNMTETVVMSKFSLSNTHTNRLELIFHPTHN